MAIQIARNNSLSSQCNCNTKSAFERNLNAKANSKNPKTTLNSFKAIIPHLKSKRTDSTVPHKLFQYMFAGIPIIASDCLPLERIIKETQTGFIYQNEDFNDLAAKILELFRNEELQKEFARNGKQAVKIKYNWNYDKKVLFNLYDKMSS